MGDPRGSFQMRLPPRSSSVGEARRMVRRSLTRAGRHDLVETAELLVSEVVTNALVHAGTPIDVTLSVARDGLLVEIGDGSPHLPSRRTYAPTAGTGRGLVMLEQMVTDWGVVASHLGKTVWFQLASGDHPGDDRMRGHGPATARSRAGESVRIQLLDVPLLLHAAWQQHAESLLREHLLARLDTDAEEDPIRVHADASDAMALLAEHIPRPDIGDDADPDQVMGSATEPKVSRPRVEVPVPVESVPHFATLDRSLEAAVTLADEGVFLTPPIQPELRTLRRWLCGQVADQYAGADPMPWSAQHEQPPDARDVLRWDTTSVDESAQSLIAADDASRIIAVSRGALDLLGYQQRDELVGQRLVCVIPDRYHQAHLAGFTMHFLTGRSPLLGNAVVVPARRRDGEEVLVELMINSHRVPKGRTVFVAELSPS